MADYYSLTPTLVTLQPGEPSPLLVLPESGLRLRKAVERLALHFKRELRYDFPQFEASETREKHYFVPWEAYLFHATADELWHGEGPVKSRFIGAACFRWREWTNAPHEWSLDWTWFHPYFRTRGHLSKAWPHFRQKYGEFHLAHPLSPAMQAFLERVGHGAA